MTLRKCWCGTGNPYFAPLYGRCGGYGHIECLCGGDFCVCHNHGDVECFGCPDCEPEDDQYPEEDGNPSADLSVRGPFGLPDVLVSALQIDTVQE